MIKSLTFLKRKAGMSLEEFQSHYEGEHAPLAAAYMPKATRYFRRYIHPEGNPTVGDFTNIEYDVITEIWFETRADFDETMAALSEPRVRAIFAQDEARMFDRAMIKLVTVEERETTLANPG